MKLVFLLSILLAGCSTSSPNYVLPPAQLTATVTPPVVPNPKTASQKTVALYLIELHKSLQLANNKLNQLQIWRQHWTK